MIHLRTLGLVQFEGASASLAGRRRELALAAFLAFRAPRPCQRAELASLLWESSDDARARQSLRQALLELKRILGDAIRVDSEQISIDPDLLTLDVQQLSRATDEGRLADAVDLWQGDFLPGMDDVGGEAFRAWLEAERQSARQVIVGALTQLVERSSTSGDWPLAIQWSERWVTLFPLDERANRWLIEALHQGGRSAEASRCCERFASRLSAELDQAPSPEFVELQQRLSRETPSQRAPGSAALFSPDFTGRTAELAELLKAWDSARAGQPVVVVLEGEPGSGKTRLAEEFRRRLIERGQPAIVLRMPSPEAGAAPVLTPIGVMLEGISEAPGLAAASRPSLTALGNHVPGILRRFPPSGVPAPLDEAIVDVLAAVSEEQPVLLWLDDVGQLDAASRNLLASVVRRLRGAILVIATGQSAASWTTTTGDSRHQASLIRLQLQPLSIPEIERLLASMMALDPADRHRLASRLHSEGAGNPFYIIEMTSALVDEGRLAPTPAGGWRLSAQEGWSLPLPSSLRAAITRRLDQLGSGPIRVAQAAAVLGPRADRAVLAAVANVGTADLADALDVLLAARLLRDAPRGNGELEFRHDLTARTIYDRIPLAQRSALHAAAANALAQFTPESAAARASIAYHRSRSHRPRRYWLWAAAVAVVAAGGFVLSRNSRAAPVQLNRVVVASFENQTGDSTLNAAGQFMADWITQGIAQSDIVPVVDVRTALTSERIVGADTAKRGVTRLRALAAEAGAARIIWGTYTLRGDSLVVQASISDASSGQIVRVLTPVRVPSRDPSVAVAQVSQGVLGALALLYDARDMNLLKEVKHPPVYAAYRAFMTGMDLLVLYQSEQSATQFALAYHLDTTFTQALAWEADAYEQIGAWASADSVLQLAERSRERLGSYEQLFLDYRRAELASDFGRALDKAREMAKLAPGSEATFLQGAMAILLERPNEALRALAQVDPDKGFLKGWDGYWGYPMKAHMMLGQLDLALADAREGRRRYPDSRQAVHQEVTVLSAMGNEVEVNHLLDIEDGLPDSPGLPLARTMRGAATIFRAYGFDSAAHRMAERAVALLPNRDPTAAGDENRLILVEALYLLARYTEASPIVALMGRRFPDDMTWQGYTGLIAARLGRRTEADSIMRRLADDRRPYAFGRGTLWRARIEAALGNDQQAITLLRTGLAQGLTFDQAFIREMPDFKELRRYDEFRELFKPRG
ncbi:MAG: AAA family ATPase [Gemmatimonadota bacterium]